MLFFPMKKIQSYVNKNLQNFNKISSKIDQAHCSISIRIMRSPLSQRFQHFLYNKAAKVEKKTEIFSDSFHT